jgi:hypothetical protein
LFSAKLRIFKDVKREKVEKCAEVFVTHSFVPHCDVG